MQTLMTRIGGREDPNRSLMTLNPRAAGTFGGTVSRTGERPVETYGNSLQDAIRMSFYWANLHLVTLFDYVNLLAVAMEGGEEDGKG